MAGGPCTGLQSRPPAFLEIPSVTADALQRLVPSFEAALQGHRGERAQERPYDTPTAGWPGGGAPARAGGDVDATAVPWRQGTRLCRWLPVSCVDSFRPHRAIPSCARVRHAATGPCLHDCAKDGAAVCGLPMLWPSPSYHASSRAVVTKCVNGAKVRQISIKTDRKSGAQACASVHWASTT